MYTYYHLVVIQGTSSSAVGHKSQVTKYENAARAPVHRTRYFVFS